MTLASKTPLILKIMRVIAWIAFIGFLIQGFSILGLTIFTVLKDTGAEDFYDHMDLSILLDYSKFQFIGFNSFLVLGSFLKSIVWLLVIKTLTGFNLSQPFTMEVIKKLEEMSYFLFSIWVINIIANIQQNYLLHRTGEFFGEKASGEFLFMAGLVFVISQIFKRGVEMQTENELTV
ncbi:DUF2975 domain-containing protein [Algoriphagus sediminis]|uniref:DUF2975 domain-containing protein n=1 Tax=Algoriphagus sediminis TaxID=3057113 RepID=A0ABT7YGL0_9BACT|nr:DUF2975 domain-containing protein [Algoriphagus sediminis]MDN3205334.1 DUF2975 domain-containing protein [Algoriphagus sediminis]